MAAAMELATRTSALRVIEHRLRDAVLYWEKGEASGGAPVSESTATGKRAGNPSTAEVACHIAGALYLVLCDAHALQTSQRVGPEEIMLASGAGAIGRGRGGSRAGRTRHGTLGPRLPSCRAQVHRAYYNVVEGLKPPPAGASAGGPLADTTRNRA